MDRFGAMELFVRVVETGSFSAAGKALHAGQRVPARVRVLIEHLEETFALCTQFNPR